MIVEKDVLIPTGRGDPVAADVFRPDGSGAFPVLATMSPYGKDVQWRDRYPLYEQTDQGPYAVWETPYPEWWVARGYVVVRADSPGTGNSPGSFDPLGPREVDGYYDAIEWAGQQPWSNGHVGALGISWLAMLQWLVAARQPPHLGAIIPWEGSTDPYREFLRHGGILSNAFLEMWWKLQIEPQIADAAAAGAVDLRVEMRKRPLLDQWYKERTPDLKEITVPVLASANWGSLVLHHRGVLEAYGAVASECAQLVISAGTHIGPFYEDWAKERQLRFLDRWLKNDPNGAEDDAPVRLAVRSCGTWTWRDESEWPIARTRWRRLYLEAAEHSMAWTAPEGSGSSTYEAADGCVSLTYTCDENIELTGPVALHLWLSSSTTDADVFVRLQHFSPEGDEYLGVGPQGSAIPLAMGWLRASHRKLDEERSLPYRPYHTHDAPVDLGPGEPTLLSVEVWPTSMVLPKGHRLVLRIASNDDDLVVFAHNDPDDRVGQSSSVTIHTGSSYDSHLLLPVVPPVP